MYTYSKLIHNLKFLKRVGADVGYIGLSEDGRNIPYVFVGDKKAPCIFITAGIHAREHVSCYLCMRQIEYTLNEFVRGKFKGGGIYFMPMLNPDGNMIIARGVSESSCANPDLLREIFKTSPTSLFKANARGVDLNVNFDAQWGTGASNVREAGGANYIGSAPFSERETRAIARFTLKKKPLSTVSYHCLGQEIYWEFGQRGEDYSRDKKLVEFINKPLGYRILDDDGKSAGGYKDWCIQKLKIPAFTIELCPDEYLHPFTDYCRANEELKKHLDLPLRLLSKIIDYKL